MRRRTSVFLVAYLNRRFVCPAFRSIGISDGSNLLRLIRKQMVLSLGYARSEAHVLEVQVLRPQTLQPANERKNSISGSQTVEIYSPSCGACAEISANSVVGCRRIVHDASLWHIMDLFKAHLSCNLPRITRVASRSDHDLISIVSQHHGTSFLE